MGVDTLDELIARYRAAYARANGRTLDVALVYEAGSFVFRDPDEPMRFSRDRIKTATELFNSNPAGASFGNHSLKYLRRKWRAARARHARPPSTAETEEVGR
jgi:hypothetical protein